MASSLSLFRSGLYSARMFTQKNKWRKTSPVFCFWVLIFFHTITRTFTQSCEHHTISFLTTRPFERVLARRNAQKRFWFFREKREREAVFFLRSRAARVFSPFFFFLKVSSSLERKNAKKNAHVCFIKKKKKKCANAFSSCLFEKNVGRLVLRARNEARFSVAKSRLRAFFITRDHLFFLRLFFCRRKNVREKCDTNRHHRRLNAKRRRRRRRRPPRARRNRKREKKRTTRRTTTPPFFFILSLGESSETINGVFRRRPESDSSKAPPRVPRCQTTTS